MRWWQTKVRLGVYGAGLALVGTTVAPLSAVQTLAAQQASLTAEQARSDFRRMARNGGYWVASNDRYTTEESGEPDEYRMAFELTPDGYSIVGCMWGSVGFERSEPFWYLMHAWDPTTETVLAYQSSPGGAIAIGRERPAEGGGMESIQTLRWTDGSTERVRHLNRPIDGNTLESRSFGSPDAGEGSWEPRRSYTWVWRPSEEVSPCSA